MQQFLYVCVYVPEFPVQTLLRLRQDLAHTPVAVLSGAQPFEQVCSINTRARKLGVAYGMSRSELDCFDALSILRRSLQQERSARSVLVEAALLYTPRLQIWPSPLSAFVMVLDMTGTKRMFGQIKNVMEQVASSLHALGFFSHLSASSNFHAAVCVAPSASRTPLILPEDREAEHLRPLPLASLNLAPSLADRLLLWGLHTLGDLADLPETELVTRLGQEGKRLRLLARGEHPHLMVPEEGVFSLEEYVSFDTPIELLDSLLFILGPMLNQLLTRAASHALALASVVVRLDLDGGGSHERTIKPALPALDRILLLKLLHIELKTHPPSSGVLGIYLHAEPGLRTKIQLGIFAPQTPESQALDVTLARVGALVGEERVGRPRLLDTHRPGSFVVERFVVPDTTPARMQPRVTTAIRRCRPPVPVAVNHRGRRPVAFSHNSRNYAIKEIYGPWRRSGKWWASEVWSLEEWDVQAVSIEDDVLLCVLAHDLLHHRWHLEALYD